MSDVSKLNMPCSPCYTLRMFSDKNANWESHESLEKQALRLKQGSVININRQYCHSCGMVISLNEL